MRVAFLIIFSPVIWASSLVETQTAVGVSNTIQGTAQANPQELVNQAKEAVKNSEKAQQERQDPALSNPSREPQSIPKEQAFEQVDLSNQEQQNIEGLDSTISPSSSVEENRFDDIFSEPDKLVRSEDKQNLGTENKEEQIKNELLKMGEKPIDYKLGTHVFYKKICKIGEENCKRSGAILTNIKSVIFDYAHSRGSFSENSDKSTSP